MSTQYIISVAPLTFDKLIANTVADTGKKEGCLNLTGLEWKIIVEKAINEYENSNNGKNDEKLIYFKFKFIYYIYIKIFIF